MKWFKRGMWLSALSVWVWLGFGLYRELPRDLGPIVSRVTLDDRERPWAFLDERELVTQLHVGERMPSVFRVRDVESGRTIRQFAGHSETLEYYELNRELTARHGLFLTAKRPEIVDRPLPAGLSVLNLRTGEWTDLPLLPSHYEPTIHREKAWAIFNSPEGSNRRGRVHVLNLETGRVMFHWEGRRKEAPDRELNEQAFFIGESLLGIPTIKSRTKPHPANPTNEVLEVWSFSDGAGLLKEFKGMHVGDDVVSSKNGRIAWHEKGQDQWVDVFDVEQGRMVFSHPKNRTRLPGDYMGVFHGPMISEDGRAVLGVMNDTLWDVETGRELWKARLRREDLAGFAKGAFQVREKWTFNLGEILFWERETYAVRDLGTGSVRFRCWEFALGRCECIRDGRGLTFDGETVREFPPPPNWPLLALCQTILALPLILLWAILRWRRKRKAVPTLRA